MDDLIRLAHLFDEDSVEHPDDPFIAIATVVGTVGSAYRRPGARILIRRSGVVAGSISAGCLESDVVAHCEDLTEPKLLTYDGTSALELTFGLQLGCAGLIQILLEPLSSLSHQSLFNLTDTRKLLQTPGDKVSITLFENDSSDGTQSPVNRFTQGLMVIGSRSSIAVSECLPEELRQLLVDSCVSALAEKRTHIISTPHSGAALVEYLKPSPSILIFGSGADTEPFLSFADTLGWQVTLADTKPARNESASKGSKYLRIDQRAPFSELETESIDAVVVMSHDYFKDKDYLEAALNTNIGYISIMGPRSRTQKLLAEITLSGTTLDENRLAALKSPAGLNIGAERPEEIALSILAEIRSVLSSRPGGYLSDAHGAIHEPVQTQLNVTTLVEAAVAPQTACKLS